MKYFRLVLGFWMIGQFSAAQTITYELTAGNLSLEAVDSYPQKLISHVKDDSLHRIIIRIFAAYSDSAKRQIVQNNPYICYRVYPESVQVYLEPTPLTDYHHPEINRTADSIARLGDSLTVQIIGHALNYSSRRITYDEDLALELDAGNSTTLSVAAVLERGKGTCSEYTNLFIALMRRLGVPCRMAVGWIYLPEQNFEGSHAWAECYIDAYGWVSVDPQNGFMWFPPIAIKLFHGKDFLDCRIETLPDMYPVKVKIL